MRLFNRTVFEGTAYYTEQFSPSELNELLGAADALAFHVHATRVSGTTKKVAITIYHSNDNQNWVLYEALPATSTLSDSAANDVFVSEKALDANRYARGSFVRIGVKMDQTSGDSADVVISVTGRSI
jgi:hypothetical protein